MSRNRAAERISKELIEAGFEIAFSLCDMSREQYDRGDRTSALRSLQDAEDVSLDIDRRLTLLGAYDRQTFDPLVGELKRALTLTKTAEA